MFSALKQCNNKQIMKTLSQSAVNIVENLATTVMLFDKNLQLLFINGSGEDLLFVSYPRVLGMTPKQIWPHSSFFYEAIKRSLNLGSTCIERNVDLSLNNGQTINVDCMITPVMVDDVAEEIVVELVDAKVFLRVLQEESQQTVQEAAKVSVQGMAHEIKNPLGGIRGAAQLLSNELEDKELLEYTGIIINECDRLRNFVDRMLATTNLPVKSETNIHEILEYVVSVVRAENSHKLHIKKDYDPSIPNIIVDREHIIQAILNLLRNAVEEIGSDGEITLITRIQRQITIQHKLHRHIIVVDIIDNGRGIPPEIESGAFYPLVTGRAEGTGLGLPIAQQLIQSHGGLINYERKENTTCFSILLPLEQCDE